MADFKTPNLCGANESLNDALSKIKNLKDEILAQSTALPSIKKAAFESKLTELKTQAQTPPIKVKGTDEQIKKGVPASYEVPLTFDNSNFFG